MNRNDFGCQERKEGGGRKAAPQCGEFEKFYVMLYIENIPFCALMALLIAMAKRTNY